MPSPPLGRYPGKFENIRANLEVKTFFIFRDYTNPMREKSKNRKIFIEDLLLRTHLTCLHDQNKSGFFGGSAFIQPIRAI